MVTHSNVMIEHPEVVADRIVRWARVVAWAKLAALAEGARLATQRLWS